MDWIDLLWRLAAISVVVYAVVAATKRMILAVLPRRLSPRQVHAVKALLEFAAVAWGLVLGGMPAVWPEGVDAGLARVLGAAAGGLSPQVHRQVVRWLPTLNDRLGGSVSGRAAPDDGSGLPPEGGER